MERDHLKAPESEHERREAELYADLHARIAHTRELTRRSRDLLTAVSAEPRTFRRDD